MALAIAALPSCEDENDMTIVPGPEAVEVAPQGASVGEGATIDPTTSTIHINYGTEIELGPEAKVNMSNGTVNSFAAEGQNLVVNVSLAPLSSYTLTVPSTAVKAKGSKCYAVEYTLNFNTGRTVMNVIDASKLSASLTNANATAEAKAVFNLLKENYGKKQLSGAMGEVAWATGFYDEITALTGKAPAIIGFDYIHLNSSAPSSWIDYADITPVKSSWEAGAIPAMTWHWNVPTDKEGDNVEYNAKNDVFNAANVTVDGTWENGVAVKDVEKLAGYLKLLQDANIPVLWRPFHEAVGDYTWGHWFWWGNAGVEVTKDLWKWLRNKLENEYGINNLIWVWTVQTSDEGKLASLDKLQAAYPGDDVVDIVGADLYVDSYSNCSAEFELLYNLVGGKKLVALSECGNLLDVNEAIADNALWSFFMSWYDWNEAADKAGLGGQWNLGNEWTDVLNNPAVLNRGDFSF